MDQTFKTSKVHNSILTVTQKLTTIQGSQSDFLNHCSGLKSQSIQLVQLLRSALYPQVFSKEVGDGDFSPISVSYYLLQSAELLRSMLAAVMPEETDADGLICEYLSALPEIKLSLETDIQAAYEGDPAAKNNEEIMLAYPAFEAISIFRLAHKLYELKIPMIPRMMTEYAHQITGVDIHPGATIGDYFFMDHGTGIVIGETCVIGEHVKLYQGVTLGAKSFEIDESGNPVKGVKRHPNIGNHVVIYAGATILGGETYIGDNCVIGGNVWLIHSVEAGKTVLAAEERAHCKIADRKVVMG